MRLFYILSAALFVGQAAATVNSALVARQSTSNVLASIPGECKDACSDATTILKQCSDSTALSASDATKCICMANVTPALNKCFDCLARIVEDNGGTPAAVSAIKQLAKDSEDQLKTGCDAVHLPADGDSSSTDEDESAAITSRTSADDTIADDAGRASTISFDLGALFASAAAAFLVL